VTHLVNAERKKHGLKPLLPSRPARCVRAAVVDRAEGQRRSAEARQLRAPRAAVSVHLRGKPKRRRSVGENLAFGTGPFSTPREIVKDWMSSPGHRASILRRWHYGAVGSAPTGGDGITVVHHFGRNSK
jgi:uncharacterized protein YkwD